MLLDTAKVKVKLMFWRTAMLKIVLSYIGLVVPGNHSLCSSKCFAQ